MRIRLFTLKEKDTLLFGDDIPESVYDSIGKREFFTLCAADIFNEPIGLLQFYVGRLSDGRSIAEIVHVYVKEEHRRTGVASRLVSGALSTMEESSIGRVVVFIPKASDKALSFFASAGFMGLAPDEKIKEYLERRYGKSDTADYTLLVRFIGVLEKK